MNEDGVPWMRLRLGNGDVGVTGLSVSQVGWGDPRVAALVLAAVLDFTLHATPEHRGNVDVVEVLLARLRLVTTDLPHLDAEAGASSR